MDLKVDESLVSYLKSTKSLLLTWLVCSSDYVLIRLFLKVAVALDFI